MQQYGTCSHIYPPDSLGMRSIGQKSTFTEHDHVAYQIKENHECSNMVTNILPEDPHPHPTTLGMGPIVQNSTFSEHGHVAYKNKGITKCSSMVA